MQKSVIGQAPNGGELFLPCKSTNIDILIDFTALNSPLPVTWHADVHPTIGNVEGPATVFTNPAQQNHIVRLRVERGAVDSWRVVLNISGILVPHGFFQMAAIAHGVEG